MSQPKRHGALRHPDFLRWQLARLLGVLALQVQGVTVAWQVLDATHAPLALGAVGLAQFLPLLLAVPIGGAVADRHDRRLVVGLAYAAYAIACAALLLLHRFVPLEIRPLYAVLVLVGGVRAFVGPAASAMLGDVVPEPDLPNAIAWSSSSFQLATIVGPALGGLLYRFGGPEGAYAAATSFLVVSAVLALGMAPKRPQVSQTPRSALEGLRYLAADKTLLAASSLDLVAVILAGSVALLPLIADELRLGPTGLGAMRAAPALGAALVGAWLTRAPIERHAGRIMLASVAAFGLATIVFGLTRVPLVAFAALIATGAFDMVSVFVRQSIMQRRVPSEVRGRVAAVNLLFVSASNELGEMESGLSAELLGVRPAIALGGALSVLVAVVYVALARPLRELTLGADGLKPLPKAPARDGGSPPS